MVKLMLISYVNVNINDNGNVGLMFTLPHDRWQRQCLWSKGRQFRLISSKIARKDFYVDWLKSRWQVIFPECSQIDFSIVPATNGCVMFFSIVFGTNHCIIWAPRGFELRAKRFFSIFQILQVLSGLLLQIVASCEQHVGGWPPPA